MARYQKQKKLMSKDLGHKQAYEDEQTYLRRQLKAWDRNNCPDDPDVTGGMRAWARRAEDWVDKPYPWPSSFGFKIGPFTLIPILA